MTFPDWFDRFLSDKGITLHGEVFIVEGHRSTQVVSGHALRQFILGLPLHMRRDLLATLARLDFANQPVRPYLKYIAEGVARASSREAALA